MYVCKEINKEINGRAYDLMNWRKSKARGQKKSTWKESEVQEKQWSKEYGLGDTVLENTKGCYTLSSAMRNCEIRNTS